MTRYVTHDGPFLIEPNSKPGAWDLCQLDGSPGGVIDLSEGAIPEGEHKDWIELFASTPVMLAALAAQRSYDDHRANCELCLQELECSPAYYLCLRAMARRNAALGVLAFWQGADFWTPVADGLPEDEEAVLAWVIYDDSQQAPSEWPNLAHYRTTNAWAVHGYSYEDGDFFTVTHWREIPTPKPTGGQAAKEPTDV